VARADEAHPRRAAAPGVPDREAAVTAAVPHYPAAVRLLGELAGPHGIHASLADTANYRAVFARDAVMSGAAGLLAGEERVAAGLLTTLRHLRDLQGREGQVASNYELGDGAPRVSFGTLAPRIDAATWYLVGVALGARAGVLDAAEFAASARAVVRLLDALEYNGRHLVYVPAGGNWADEYVYEGYILYDQVLRAWALRLLGGILDEPAWPEKAARIEQRIDESYWPDDREARGYPLAAHSPVRRGEMFDLAACSLLALSGLVPPRADAALDWIARHYLDGGALPPAFAPVIDEGHPEWPALRRYHLHGFRNHPHEYHNGGVWPVWLGWLALALARAGRTAELDRLRALVAERLDAAPGFAFEEYLHGLTGAPGGTPLMGYTATGLVFLALADSAAARRLFSDDA
jgi:glycogen debranching enzyme